MIKLRFAEQEALKVELLGAEGQLAADRLALLEATNDLGLARSMWLDFDSGGFVVRTVVL